MSFPTFQSHVVWQNEWKFRVCVSITWCCEQNRTQIRSWLMRRQISTCYPNRSNRRGNWRQKLDKMPGGWSNAAASRDTSRLGTEYELDFRYFFETQNFSKPIFQWRTNYKHWIGWRVFQNSSEPSHSRLRRPLSFPGLGKLLWNEQYRRISWFTACISWFLLFPNCTWCYLIFSDLEN